MSCSADRQILAKINKDGVFLEKLERNPAHFLPEVQAENLENSVVVQVDLNKPMEEILKTLNNYPIKTRLSLNGTLIVARDIAHAKMLEMLQKTGKLPDYMIKYPGIVSNLFLSHLFSSFSHLILIFLLIVIF